MRYHEACIRLFHLQHPIRLDFSAETSMKFFPIAMEKMPEPLLATDVSTVSAFMHVSLGIQK
ncbi:MAG: hypothetical protein A3I66_15880 [Burkholderiales bacterium RIFCSPLOWO2_02_FULL_57_36]|nr:MAG: hypothetical protein A3I66_15880 [Burkholderiales bacterium RIFCSPLOWO2_02_FULL_57_36]